MEKREKIILAATLAAAIYGALDFFVLSAKKEGAGGGGSQAASAMLSSITSQLAGQGGSGSDQVRQRIEMVNVEWNQDVFFETSSESLFTEGEERKKEESLLNTFEQTVFTYTGYLVMDDRKIAIINGSDYNIGEIVQGFTLEEIRPQSIRVSLEGQSFDVEIVPSTEF